MAKTTIYAVQPVYRSGQRGPAKQFAKEADALRAGERLVVHSDHVQVLKVTGCPVTDLWTEPVVLQEFRRHH